MSIASDNLVAALVSAATGRKVNTLRDFENMKKEKEHLHPMPVNLDSLHEILLKRGPVSKAVDKNEIVVFVKTLAGHTLAIYCSPTETIEHFKDLIAADTGIPPDQQRLIFAGRQLANEPTLHDLRIGDGYVMHLILRLRGGAECMVYLDGSLRSPAFDYDFTNITDEGTIFNRGGYLYRRPVGCIRLALNVMNRYENNNWLGVVGRTSITSDVSGEWNWKA